MTREDWRTKVNHQRGELEGFYVKITTALYYNEKAQLSAAVPEDPAIPTVGSVNPNTIFEQAEYRERSHIFRAPNDQQVRATYPTKEYHSGKHERYMGIDPQEQQESLSKKWAEIYYKTAERNSITEHRFYIPYDTQNDIRQLQKKKINNMFVEVADPLLKTKSGFPCKYTAIQVQESNRIFSAFQKTDHAG